MKIKLVVLTLLLVLSPFAPIAQEELTGAFDQASGSIRQQLEASVAELNQLREQVAVEKIPLSRKLNQLESKLAEVRVEYQNVTRLLDSRTLDLSNLRTEIQSRKEESTYLSNLLSEYIRNFESRLHISEIQRYREPLEEAKLALDNSGLSQQQVYQAQAKLVETSLERLHEALGGSQFTGMAVNSDGLVKPGTFVLVGPAAMFRSNDGLNIGTAEQRLGSLEPTVMEFNSPEDTLAAENFFTESSGVFLFDPTLGSAHKIEETQETFVEHVEKGGVVMYPIFAMATAALLVALFKWLGMAFVRTPSQKKIRLLLEAVETHDVTLAKQKAKAMGGPVGRMLTAGLDHIKEPRELVEEMMYEKVLDTRLRLERFLPFIAISAASAPLLGLLGTVTGIINTFKLITVFGSGDVKTLSGGISEALITTEFGLIVAIPSLLIHAFLYRKAKGIINKMEKAAIALVNQIGKTPYTESEVKDQLQQISAGRTSELLPSIAPENRPSTDVRSSFAKDLMNPNVVRVGKTSTVAETIGMIRSSEIDEDIDSVFVVDEQGKYIGHVHIRHLLTRPEHTDVESIADKKPLFVRVDTHSAEVQDLLLKHDMVSLPVLDHDDQPVGCVTRRENGARK